MSKLEQACLACLFLLVPFSTQAACTPPSSARYVGGGGGYATTPWNPNAPYSSVIVTLTFGAASPGNLAGGNFTWTEKNGPGSTTGYFFGAGTIAPQAVVSYYGSVGSNTSQVSRNIFNSALCTGIMNLQFTNFYVQPAGGAPSESPVVYAAEFQYSVSQSGDEITLTHFRDDPRWSMAYPIVLHKQ